MSVPTYAVTWSEPMTPAFMYRYSVHSIAMALTMKMMR